MKQAITENHVTDENGNPTGGTTTGVGISISWQNGPLGRGDDRQAANGAFTEGVIQSAIGRLEFYQASKFASSYNAEALTHLRLALEALERRTTDREKRAVEGTHQV
jgi:hypothetical protein